MDGVGEDQIVKRDVLGRATTSRERREALLDAAQPPRGEFERSGLKGTQFASAVGVNYKTFAAKGGSRVLRHPPCESEGTWIHRRHQY